MITTKSSKKKKLDSIETTLREKDIKLVGMGTPDIDGRFKGKFFDKDYFINSAAKSGGFLCDILFGWDITDEIYEGEPPFSGWQKGFPDIYMMPDLDTLHIKSWGNKTASFIADLYTTDGEELQVSPRTVLKQQIDKAKSLGYEFSFGYELEFYVFKETSSSIKEKQHQNLTPSTTNMTTYGLEEGPIMDFFSELWSELKEYGIPVESLMYEAGPGQFEFSVDHGSPLKIADKMLLYKAAIKEIAAKHEMTVTFMAKHSEEQSGSSGHVHQSMYSVNDLKTNLYWSEDSDNMSEVMKQSIAGIIDTLPSFTALYCPTINSYSRLVSGSWTGINSTWATDNRTTALRSIKTNEKAIRIENRIPGADANPYLVLAACIAGSLHGIENQVPLPNEVNGNAYTQQSNENELPLTLESSVRKLKESEVAKQYFNQLFLDHYIFTRERELDKYREAVTDWEIKRYLERV